MKRTKKLVANLAVLAVSTGLALVLCEFGARLILNPADYLSQDMVPDKILGAVLTPRGDGYDKWGFRNKSVPATAEIVAIGDSHTFGNTAKMEESWPYALGRSKNTPIYNMGLGGYGPNQYYHLLKTKALGLKPKTIVCGLYMGDDFENAFRITYGLEHWTYLRGLKGEVQADADIWGTGQRQKEPGMSRKLRTWLSRNSVIYKLVFHGPLLGRIKGNLQIENAARLYDSTATLIIEEKNIREAFLPRGILQRIDQDKEAVQEGMRITFQLLKEMDALCRQNGVEFVVAVIPTKETVFSEFFSPDPQQPLRQVILDIIANEQRAREKLFAFFKEAQIRHVDTLPFLKAAVGNELYARTAVDIHPGRNGYKVIADAIAAGLDKAPAVQSGAVSN